MPYRDPDDLYYVWRDYGAIADLKLDPLTLTSVAVGLGLVTMLACYVPARRVLGIDPVQLLRRE